MHVFDSGISARTYTAACHHFSPCFRSTLYYTEHSPACHQHAERLLLWLQINLQHGVVHWLGLIGRVHPGEKWKYSIKSIRDPNKKVNTDFRPSQWLIIDVNSVLGSLHCVVVVNVDDVSEVHTPSICRASSATYTFQPWRCK
jgi:hypothetical protein